MGAVEVVRIVTGQTTSGSFDFTQVNKGTGDISRLHHLRDERPDRRDDDGAARRRSRAAPP